MLEAIRYHDKADMVFLLRIIVINHKRDVQLPGTYSSEILVLSLERNLLSKKPTLIPGCLSLNN